MEIFKNLNFYLKAHVNSYLSTRKLVYDRFTDKESWEMINAVKHAYCIKKADKKKWAYISGSRKFHTKRTQHAYCSHWQFGIKRKDLVGLPKWETVIRQNYKWFWPDDMHLIRDYGRLLHEEITSSVKEKYDQIRREPLSIFHEMAVAEYAFDDAEACTELQEIIHGQMEEVRKIVDYKLAIMAKQRSGYGREKLWEITKKMFDINFENVFTELNSIE